MGDFPCCEAPGGHDVQPAPSGLYLKKGDTLGHLWVIVAENPETGQVVIQPEESENGYAWELVSRSDIV